MIKVDKYTSIDRGAYPNKEYYINQNGTYISLTKAELEKIAYDLKLLGIGDVSGSAYLPIPLLDNIQTFPIYYWVKGWVNYQVHRNYRDGSKEVIVKVPISVTGSKKIIELITKILSETKKDIQSDEICEKHSWIKTKRGRICENCGEWTQHYR